MVVQYHLFKEHVCFDFEYENQYSLPHVEAIIFMFCINSDAYAAIYKVDSEASPYLFFL